MAYKKGVDTRNYKGKKEEEEWEKEEKKEEEEKKKENKKKGCSGHRLWAEAGGRGGSRRT